ncbi:type I-E CRISPR-associated endonuclease Cas1e [Myceligenerans pegani]|uniref:CRISPR-associated endonuclease Cas1 n=1 Tax=Myceligenerans pegani TaxID=2776917 RepID=A0ABR9N268_9MICO|nr:type I-E CRISPR-associated endonuclease Cas1e [Myceligenerans sp. TRM 65318]MBE1877450.1 type I-E CRISPR-associated endonuclease Cas1 [Myceligenerans sp. TRM 65318]MBE3019721.1 type I-E CRISPR-associated endonuclease Cas1 [Myceligenerans sp. TRM 65318]
MNLPGTRPAKITELARVQDRMTFVYIERAVISREDGAITSEDGHGTVHIPAASLGALLLGPGTTVSQQAMVLLAESGSTVVWVGERGVRYYAHGRSLARSTRLLEAQAEVVTNRNKRLACARAMYAMRLPGEDVSRLTMQQLRGREGARVRKVYRHWATKSGVDWNKRDVQLDDFEATDTINQALSAAASCLYGVVYSVVVALGCAPGLGVVHTGNERSFVFDIADLYRAELSIPVAFEVVAQDVPDVAGAVRRAMRDRMFEMKLLERCVRDVQTLLLNAVGDVPAADGEDIVGADVIKLWDDRNEAVTGGRSYGWDTLDEPDDLDEEIS